MDINKLTEKLQEALSSAQSKAVRYSHQQVDVEHLLLALLEQERGLANSDPEQSEYRCRSPTKKYRTGTRQDAKS